MNATATLTHNRLHAGMIGMGMIFDDTYRPFFEKAHRQGIYRRDFGLVDIELTAVASRTGKRAEAYKKQAGERIADFASFAGEGAVGDLLHKSVDAVCVATPDDRHFEAARQALTAGKHVLIEKPSVLSLQQLDDLQKLAKENGVLAKIVYHKLLDPDHKKLRTLVHDGILQHVNNGYCSLLEPKSISGGQFAEWIRGRNPGTYVAVHYIKLIDFSFGPDWKLKRITATGQRGLVGEAEGPTWDSTQLRIVYQHQDQREAAFDIHTSWVMPDNFPGYVEQEVQFCFDNAIWRASQRNRGVELTIEDRTPGEFKITPNNHYNGTFVEPWGERSQRGYGIEGIERFFEEVAYVEFGGAAEDRNKRLQKIRQLSYNDVGNDRNTVAVVQALEAILAEHAAGRPDAVVEVNAADGGLVLRLPGRAEPMVLYEASVEP